MISAEILLLIDNEINRANQLHGPLPDIDRAGLILAEECGEVCAASMEVIRTLRGGGTIKEVSVRLEHLEEEVVQVAAVAVRWLQKLHIETTNRRKVKCHQDR